MTDHNEKSPNDSLWMAKPGLQSLISVLHADGFTVIAPTIQEGAIVYDEIQSTEQLPIGWRDAQRPGEYRLRETSGDSLFEFNVGPHSWKRYLFPPREVVASAERTDDGWQFQTGGSDPTRYAFLGVRACELAAIRIHDRVLTEGPFEGL